MVKNYFFLLCFFIAFTKMRSQSNISGRVIDSLQTPVPYQPIALLNAKDSIVNKGIITNESGRYSFDNVKPGSYLLKVIASGFKIKFSNSFPIDSSHSVEVPDLQLISTDISLNEVSVTVMKKTIEFKNGNITVNVEDSPLAVGNTLYELLAKLPGVTVIDDVISINGKAGVKILIDERLQQYSGQQLITLLKSINASSIQKIEILKNPPVKYDASGAGFISVKTKKVKLTGFSGSTYLNYTQGFYANRNGGLSLNYKGKDFAVFSSLNAGYDEFIYRSIFDKAITFNAITTDFHQLTAERNTSKYATYNVGADWFINKRNTIGFKVEGTQGTVTPIRNGNNYLSDNSLGYNQLVFSSVRPNTWNYINYNLNAEHVFDTLGTTLRFSFDYSPNLDLNKGDFENHFVNESGANTLAPKIFKSDNNLKFVLYSSKLDFEKQLSKAVKMEAGIKGNDQNMLSNFNFQNKDDVTGIYSTDSVYTNIFSYKEQVTAGYLNFQTQLKKYSFQIGVRGENTKIRAVSKTNSVKYDRDYFNLFPMASISYDPSEKNSYQLSVNRRIERPDYTSFNPYKYFVNLLVSFQGNPYMQPQYISSVEFTHGRKQWLYNSLSISKITNSFYGYPMQNDSTKETSNSQSNIKNCMVYSYGVYVQKEIKKWWMFTFNLSANYVDFWGQVEGRDYSGNGMQYYAFMNSQFSLPKNFKIDLNGQYMAPGNVVIYNNTPRWALNLAVQKSFFNKKCNLTIGMNDIFYTLKNKNTANYLNMRSTTSTSNDTQRFKASLSYNFGKIKVQQRKTKSNEEESNRLGH
jgi:iron complex outermembrane recepter protein